MTLNSTKDLFFDNNCILCKNKKLSNEIHFLCNECLSSFKKITDNKCKICYHPLDDFNKCPSCSKLEEIFFDSYDFIQYYTDFFKTVIYKLKIQEDFMVNYLFFRLLKIKKMIKDDGIITVVPDTFIKRLKKGRSGLFFLLKLFKIDGYKTDYNILKRNISLNKSQKNKTVSERLNEIKKIYFINDKNCNKYRGKVYLIDDIYTTGATINYCAKLLKIAGFNQVNIITFFRAKLDKL